MLIYTLALCPSITYANNTKCTKLKNDLKVCVISNHRSPMVSYGLLYDVGSIDEEADQYGIAHLLEHMMFKETTNHKSGHYTSRINEIGGQFNAHTTLDHTLYFAQFHKRYLDEILKLEADRMQNLVIDKNELETEKKVVIEERVMRIDSVESSKLSEETNHILYKNHAYGHPVAGWKESVQNTSRKNLYDFYKQHYNPANATLIIAGDITYKEAIRLAEKHYGSIDKAGKKRGRPAPSFGKTHGQTTVTIKNSRVNQKQIMRSYLQEEDETDIRKILTYTLVADILGGDNRFNRMYRKFVTEAKVADFVSADYTTYLQHGKHTTISVVPRNEIRMSKIKKMLDSLIEEALQGGIQAEELQKIKSATKAHHIYLMENTLNFVMTFAILNNAGFSESDIMNLPDIIESISLQETNAALIELFQGKSFVEGLLLPQTNN